MGQLLLFRVNQELYGLEVANLQEIIEAPPLFFIPMAPACFCGAMNFHGRILPVLDLPNFLGSSESTRDRRIIVLAEHLAPLAFTATALQRIVPFNAAALVPAKGKNFVQSCFDRENETVHLLDASALVVSLRMQGPRRL